MRDAVEAALRSAPKESGELPYRLSPSQYKILHDGAKPHGVIGGTQAQKDAKNAIDQIKVRPFPEGLAIASPLADHTFSMIFRQPK